jgi:hypothetical protein
MEEKLLIEALAAAGVAASPLPPFPTPLPVGPVPSQPFAVTVANGVAESNLVIDRLADRAVAGAIVPVMRGMGASVLDAGIAASANRFQIATALAAAGLPRPHTLLVTSEDAGLIAVKELGWPATMLPLDPGAGEIVFLDRDIAEAVLEHREVLGGSVRALALIQGGAGAGGRIDLVVVNGRAAGFAEHGERSVPLACAIELAEATAQSLGAALLGVTIANGTDGAVVWDVQPVPAFKSMTAIGERSVVAAMAALVGSRLHGPSAACAGMPDKPVSSELVLVSVPTEVRDGAFHSA